DVQTWAARVDQGADPTGSMTVTVFDTSDGVRSSADGPGYGPLVAKGSDGKLWFTGLDGIGTIDPGHLPFNTHQPAVRIEQIIADRETHDVWAAHEPINLPARTRDLEIDYTALSFVAPERNQFRILLEGKDDTWREMGSHRQAYYSDLRPRTYRF